MFKGNRYPVATRLEESLSVRWVASSYRTVAAVWNNSKPLCLHFEHASCDMGRNSAERALFGGLLKRIRSPEFIIDLGIMYDALFELSELSESLQDCDCTILIADKLLHKYIRRLEFLRDKIGTKTLEANVCANVMNFQGIELF